VARKRAFPAAAIALLALATPAGATTFTVSNPNDSGAGSLRLAIEQANAAPGSHLIQFQLQPSANTIRPLTPLPAVDGDIRLVGLPFTFPPPTPLSDREAVIDGSLQSGPKIGLHLAGDNSAVSGLAFTNFRDGQGGGIAILVEGASAHLQENYVGTDVTGMVAGPNDTGIVIRGNGAELGGDRWWERNIVSGNGVGIAVTSGAAATEIANTWIGLDAAGGPLPNTSHGLRLVDTVDTVLGSIEYDQGNRIAHNGGAGISVEGPLARNTAIFNTLLSGNGGLALDLGGDGATPNDPGDGDAGPHDLQNFPVISSALFVGTHAEIRGALDSRPNRTYRLQFHAAASVNATGRGQSERFMGSMTVTTDGSGHAPFAFDTFAVSAHFPFVSVTADPGGNGSEMSPAVAVSGTLPASATFLVNVADTANLGRCSPARCSLAEAVIATNEAANGPVPDSVHFAIPGAGPHVTDGWHYFTDAVVIDGFTQPGASPNTIPFGAGGLDAGLKVEICGLTIVRDSTVRGLAMKDCGLTLHDGSVAEGNFIGTDVTGTVQGDAFGLYTSSNNRIGGTAPAQRNLIVGAQSAVLIVGSSNLVQGNLIGTTADGSSSLGASLHGISLSSASGAPVTGNVIGGAGAAGNVISGHSSVSPNANTFGILMRAGTSTPLSGNTIRGNYIGLTADGNAPLPNKTGIGVTGALTTGNLIEGNVISGNTNSVHGTGVYLFNDSSGTTVRGNWIGTGPGGVGTFPNSNEGIAVFNDSTSNVIGTNTIRGNGRAGIAIAGATSRNTISANAISGNGTLGIDLGIDGVTPNDPGDADSGPNLLQNFPVVTAAATDGTVSATFQGAPSTTLLLEFFASPALDPSGHGEGARFLGWHLVATNGAGDASVTVTLPNAILPDEWVTATATMSADGNTSEFGPGVRATNASFPAAGLAVDATGNGVAEPNETVVVAPSWTNSTTAPITANGTAADFAGPAGAAYVLSDDVASYGTIPAGGTASCAATGDCYQMGVSFTTRPVVHLDATFDETVGPGNKTWALHVGESFADVPRTNPFYRFVETLLHRGVTGGCGADTYCPVSSATREEMAVFVLAAREGAGYAPPACGAVPLFADVPPSSPFCRWIEELARRGVVGGCGGGN
jgi:parallel beta-helix repeat protein